MLFSLALLCLSGLFFGGLLKKVGLPPLLGMLLTGIVLGPHALNLLDGNLLAISADLRKIALIIILTRAGLNLDLSDLKRVGRPAVLMCFVPACFELLAMVTFAPAILGITRLEAAIMGTVVAAVSPAVIVPSMLKIMEEGYGKRHSIPQMIMAGASVDDVFVIVLFTAFTGMAQGDSLSPLTLAEIPISILTGILGGWLCGLAVAKLFAHISMRDSAKVVFLLSLSFLLVTLEDLATGLLSFSGLLAIMTMGIALQRTHKEVAVRVAGKYAKLWVAAELLLFALVGATVDVNYALAAGGSALVLLALVLCARMVGVLCCTAKTALTRKERMFSMIAYCPKATVQAAIGSIPLTMGLACGELVLTVAVLSILLTAPLGALAIQRLYPRWLEK